MHPVQTNGTITRLAHLNGVCAVLRHDGRGVAVLNEQLGVVRTREYKALGIKNLDVGVVKTTPEAHAFDFR